MDLSVNEHEYLTTREAAHILRVSPRTMEKWRLQDKGPDFINMGHKLVRYAREEIDRWVEQEVKRSMGNAPAKCKVCFGSGRIEVVRADGRVRPMECPCGQSGMERA